MRPLPARSRGFLVRLGALVAAMVAAMAVVGALATWDAAREADASLEDFAEQQAVIARAASAELAARLPARAQEPPAEVVRSLARLEDPAERLVLVRGPGERAWQAVDGRSFSGERLDAAALAGRETAVLPPEEAARLGLPQRSAMVGLAHLDAPGGGRWEVAAVASAHRERDRERRAGRRLMLSESLAALLVLTFGGAALLTQRKELLLSRELAVAQVRRERDERLARLDRAATMLTLASGVAHEVATPLGVIVGRAEQVLDRVGGDERASRAARAILEEAERIHQVIRGFLDLARGESPALEAVPASAVVDASLALVEHRFEKAGVRLSARVPEPVPQVRCDQRLVQHALVNLLLNACDACARGGQVEVRVESDEAELRFAVVDDGAGIAAAHAVRATEPFFTTKPKGTGLGLAIASEIMKSHRGALSLAPATPRGTRAALHLPLGEGARA